MNVLLIFKHHSTYCKAHTHTKNPKAIRVKKVRGKIYACELWSFSRQLDWQGNKSKRNDEYTEDAPKRAYQTLKHLQKAKHENQIEKARSK